MLIDCTIDHSSIDMYAANILACGPKALSAISGTNGG